MNRILNQLEGMREIPPVILAFGALLLLIVPFLIPRNYRLFAALAFMSAWLNLSRFTQLVPFSSVAKVTFWLPIIVVIIAALLHPGPKRKISSWMYIYLVIPFFGMACIATTHDAALGLIYQLNLFLVALAAFCLLRTIVDYQSLRYVMWALGIGLLLPLGITTTAMLLGGHFRRGLGRFEPYGILSNQLVPVLLQFMAIGLFLFHSTQNLVFRVATITKFGLAGAQLIATGSRQGVVTLAIVLLPWSMSMIRRPVVAVLCVVVASASFLYMFEFLTEATGVQRLGTVDDSNRIAIAKEYLGEISKRPFTGLLGTRNQSCIAARDAASHAHNAYLEALYIGGLAYGGPMLVVVAMTIYSTFFVFAYRRELAMDRSQFALLWGMMGAIYAQGLISNIIFTSASSWAFMNIFISGLFLNLREDLIAGHAATWRYPDSMFSDRYNTRVQP